MKVKNTSQADVE